MIKKILQAGYFVFLGVIAALLIGTTFSTGSVNVYIVQSGSMEPAIRTGAIVITKAQESYEEGDVITFARTSENTPTTHRIIEKVSENNETTYSTKGDANTSIDIRTVNHSDVIGRVVIDIPLIGYIVVFARQPIGFALLLIVPASVVIFDEIKKITQEIKKKKDVN